jgi:hypothetical protein
MVRGKYMHLGGYKSAETAAAWYDWASRAFHKEFGLSNSLVL